MDKPDSKFTLGSNCTDIDCKSIPNSDCYAGLCKCKIGFGPSTDRRACKKSKKIGQPCHPIFDTCFMEKLQCDDISNVCQCAPGYKYDSAKNDCLWVYFCEDSMIYDSIRRQCIKPSDFWFPTTSHNPKLSFITFILLVFCFIKVMRSNSPYNERRRRISTNLNRNSFDLLSTIINYENNQRYPVRGGQPPDRHNARGLRRAGDNEENAEFYDENLPPPAYEDIIRNDDLKTVTVEPSTGDIELKELNQDARRKLSNVNGHLPEESNHSNHLNDAYTSHNHIESHESSSNTSLEGSGADHLTIRSQLPNGPVAGSDSSASQPSNDSNQSHPNENQQVNRSQPDQQQPPPNQLNQSNEQLPTYEQAVRLNSRDAPV